MSNTASGGCQCGRVRYSVEIADDDAYLCHCRMCQRATGGVAAALKEVPRDAVTWNAAEPDRYRSSPIAVRGHCAECGTPLTYEGDGSTHLDLTVGSFDEPGRFRPTSHAGIESRHEAWLDTSALPGKRTDELPNITAKWIAACGKLPD
ncbi:GFA family protein [Sphingomonas lenta]|uniref:Aldehyde-activating protein n=1 Tax=Sphingomonas lenta TaxID=1141887 RepID=A0A2A2SJN2_9SPHN|nr:GFA family protein [Sphingomonas lenta]PAX09484.1 aldehyde-activating protein [Sphingomonas lenta]